MIFTIVECQAIYKIMMSFCVNDYGCGLSSLCDKCAHVDEYGREGDCLY